MVRMNTRQPFADGLFYGYILSYPAYNKGKERCQSIFRMVQCKKS
jgi:hypothetical protein